MDRKFLLMVGSICGYVAIGALLFLPLESSGGEHSRSIHAITHPSGGLLLLFVGVGAGFGALVSLGMHKKLGVDEHVARLTALIGVKVGTFLMLAMLIAGTNFDQGFSAGYWLAFIASIVGAFAIYLTFNEKLARKIADATKDKGEAETPEEPGDAASDG